MEKMQECQQVRAAQAMRASTTDCATDRGLSRHSCLVPCLQLTRRRSTARRFTADFHTRTNLAAESWYDWYKVFSRKGMGTQYRDVSENEVFRFVVLSVRGLRRGRKFEMSR